MKQITSPLLCLTRILAMLGCLISLNMAQGESGMRRNPYTNPPAPTPAPIHTGDILPEDLASPHDTTQRDCPRDIFDRNIFSSTAHVVASKLPFRFYAKGINSQRCVKIEEEISKKKIVPHYENNDQSFMNPNRYGLTSDSLPYAPDHLQACFEGNTWDERPSDTAEQNHIDQAKLLAARYLTSMRHLNDASMAEMTEITRMARMVGVDGKPRNPGEYPLDKSYLAQSQGLRNNSFFDLTALPSTKKYLEKVDRDPSCKTNPEGLTSEVADKTKMLKDLIAADAEQKKLVTRKTNYYARSAAQMDNDSYGLSATTCQISDQKKFDELEAKKAALWVGITQGNSTISDFIVDQRPSGIDPARAKLSCLAKLDVKPEIAARQIDSPDFQKAWTETVAKSYQEQIAQRVSKLNDYLDAARCMNSNDAVYRDHTCMKKAREVLVAIPGFGRGKTSEGRLDFGTLKTGEDANGLSNSDQVNDYARLAQCEIRKESNVDQAEVMGGNAVLAVAAIACGTATAGVCAAVMGANLIQTASSCYDTFAKSEIQSAGTMKRDLDAGNLCKEPQSESGLPSSTIHSSKTAFSVASCALGVVGDAASLNGIVKAGRLTNATLKLAGTAGSDARVAGAIERAALSHSIGKIVATSEAEAADLAEAQRLLREPGAGSADNMAAVKAKVGQHWDAVAADLASLKAKGLMTGLNPTEQKVFYKVLAEHFGETGDAYKWFKGEAGQNFDPTELNLLAKKLESGTLDPNDEARVWQLLAESHEKVDELKALARTKAADPALAPVTAAAAGRAPAAAGKDAKSGIQNLGLGDKKPGGLSLWHPTTMSRAWIWRTPVAAAHNGVVTILAKDNWLMAFSRGLAKKLGQGASFVRNGFATSDSLGSVMEDFQFRVGPLEHDVYPLSKFPTYVRKQFQRMNALRSKLAKNTLKDGEANELSTLESQFAGTTDDAAFLRKKLVEMAESSKQQRAAGLARKVELDGKTSLSAAEKAELKDLNRFLEQTKDLENAVLVDHHIDSIMNAYRRYNLPTYQGEGWLGQTLNRNLQPGWLLNGPRVRVAIGRTATQPLLYASGFAVNEGLEYFGHDKQVIESKAELNGKLQDIAPLQVQINQLANAETRLKGLLTEEKEDKTKTPPSAALTAAVNAVIERMHVAGKEYDRLKLQEQNLTNLDGTSEANRRKLEAFDADARVLSSSVQKLLGEYENLKQLIAIYGQNPKLLPIYSDKPDIADLRTYVGGPKGFLSDANATAALLDAAVSMHLVPDDDAQNLHDLRAGTATVDTSLQKVKIEDQTAVREIATQVAKLQTNMASTDASLHFDLLKQNKPDPDLDKELAENRKSKDPAMQLATDSFVKSRGMLQTTLAAGASNPTDQQKMQKNAKEYFVSKTYMNLNEELAALTPTPAQAADPYYARKFNEFKTVLAQSSEKFAQSKNISDLDVGKLNGAQEIAKQLKVYWQAAVRIKRFKTLFSHDQLTTKVPALGDAPPDGHDLNADYLAARSAYEEEKKAFEDFQRDDSPNNLQQLLIRDQTLQQSDFFVNLEKLPKDSEILKGVQADVATDEDESDKGPQVARGGGNDPVTPAPAEATAGKKTPGDATVSGTGTETPAANGVTSSDTANVGYVVPSWVNGGNDNAAVAPKPFPWLTVAICAALAGLAAFFVARRK